MCCADPQQCCMQPSRCQAHSLLPGASSPQAPPSDGHRNGGEHLVPTDLSEAQHVLAGMQMPSQLISPAMGQPTTHQGEVHS